MKARDAVASVKPKMRGLLHEVAFFVSLVTGPVLVFASHSGNRLGTAMYSFTVTNLFGVSALYHRPQWKPKIRRWMRRLDHSSILFLIAGTFTPIAFVLREITWVWVAFWIVWGLALAGVAVQFLPLKVPKPVAVIPYLVLGWAGVSLLPPALTYIGVTAGILLIVGGVLYTVGAIAYARRSPNPKPEVFGYHEVFHAFVILAVMCHYSAIALAVI
ncbi:MAG: hemolysin III family protein [Actinomycetota bacterium]